MRNLWKLISSNKLWVSSFLTKYVQLTREVHNLKYPPGSQLSIFHIYPVSLVCHTQAGTSVELQKLVHCSHCGLSSVLVNTYEFWILSKTWYSGLLRVSRFLENFRHWNGGRGLLVTYSWNAFHMTSGMRIFSNGGSALSKTKICSTNWVKDSVFIGHNTCSIIIHVQMRKAERATTTKNLFFSL